MMDYYEKADNNELRKVYHDGIYQNIVLHSPVTQSERLIYSATNGFTER